MPRTADHIVHTHQLATERRVTGRPIWDHRINLSGLLHDETLSFVERRDSIVRRFQSSTWIKNADPDEWNGPYEIVNDHLAYAEDEEEFNGWLDELYDHADIDRVWIETCGKGGK